MTQSGKKEWQVGSQLIISHYVTVPGDYTVYCNHAMHDREVPKKKGMDIVKFE